MDNTNINNAKKLIANKFSIPNTLFEDRVCFKQRKDGKLVALVSFFNYYFNDNCLYLYDCDNLNNFIVSPIMQIKFQQNNSEFYLRRLEYCDYCNKNYLNKGFASDFMELLEQFCCKNGFKSIKGELIPLHNESEKHVKNFYLKNGFKINLDENKQQFISKNININLLNNGEEKTL